MPPRLIPALARMSGTLRPRFSLRRTAAVVLLTTAGMASSQGLAAMAASPTAPPAAATASTAVSAAALPPAPLPTCQYLDVLTRYRRAADWSKTLVDTTLKLTAAYRPHDLVPVSRAGLPGYGTLRGLVIHDLKAMAGAAGEAGAGIAVRSAYRSYANQADVFRARVRAAGHAQALRDTARAGHSEHQLGTTIDVRSVNSTRAPWDYPDWGTTAAGVWMNAHAWQFGFVMSFPDGQSATSCYQYEPWHYRYFGDCAGGPDPRIPGGPAGVPVGPFRDGGLRAHSVRRGALAHEDE